MTVGLVLRIFGMTLIHFALFACAAMLVLGWTTVSAEERKTPRTTKAMRRAFWTLVLGSAAYLAVVMLCRWYES